MSDEELYFMRASQSWPPGSVVQAPWSAERRIEELQAELAAARAHAAREEARCEKARSRAWYEWHQLHGWPDNYGYRARLESRERLVPKTRPGLLRQPLE